MKILNFGRAPAALLACVLWAASAAFAAVPERISYQGTLRKDSVLFNGTVPMEFRITNFNGGTIYWTSGSTDVVVTGGLFRYPLGTPNEAAFAAIDWNSVDAYVQVLLDGAWLSPEPLFSSAYALNAKTANNSIGDFTVRDGYIRISTTAGNIGLVFQDGTTQYTSAAPVWSVSGADVYISSVSYGNAGIGNAAPEARLDVQAASGGYPQIWRDPSGVIVASMTSAGYLFADASQLRNLPSGADGLGTHIATQTLNMGGFQLSNAGAVTASSYTASSALGIGAAQVRLGGSVAVSSETLASLGAGVRVSSNVYIMGFSSATKYYGDGSALSNLPIPTTIMTLDTDQTVSGVKTFSSSATVLSDKGLGAARVRFAGNIDVSSTSSAALGGGVRVSTNIYIVGFSSAAKYYGDGSSLTGVTFSPVLSQNMVSGSYWFSNDGTSKGVKVDVNGRVNLGGSGTSATGTVDVRASGAETYAQVWRNIGGSAVSSMSVAGVLYADGSGLRNIGLGSLSINRDLNMSNKDIVSVSTISVSSITSSGASITFAKNIAITTLAGSGDRCVYSDNSGVLQLAGDVCGSGAGTDNLGNHTATQPLKMGTYQITGTGALTMSSFTATNALGIGSARVRMANNVVVSSETLASLGAGVRISSNVYVVGFSSATKYYGDGSALTGITGVADDLGNHTATQDLNMAAKNIVGVSTISVSSITSAGASVTFGKDVTIANLVGGSNRCVYVDPGGVLRAELDDCGTPSGAADSLGTHIATQDLNMAAHNIINGAAVTASSYTAADPLGIGAAQLNLADNVVISSAPASQYGGVYVSSNIYAAGTFYGGGVTLSADLNVAGGNIANSYLAGTGNRCVYVDANGVLRAELSDCGTASGGDEMGLHTMTQQLKTMGFWITRNGAEDGLYLDADQNLGIGLNTPAARLDVRGPGGGGAYTQIWRNASEVIVSSMSAAGYLKAVKFIGDGSGLTGVSFNPILNQNIQMGSYWLSGDGDNEGLTVDSSGNVGISTGAPQARLDVLASGAYAQIWRDPSGAIQSSMSATGYIYADGSKLRNLPAADNMGNHTASQNLNMGGYQITGTGSVTVASYTATNALGIGVPRVRLANNVAIASATAAQYGGVYVSSNIYVAGKYYGDGSELTNVTGNDDLGDHTATQDLNMSGKDIVSVSTISVSSITSAGGSVTMSSNFYLAGDMQSVKLAGFGDRCLHVNNSGQVSITSSDCGSGGTGSDNMGDHIMIKNLRTSGYWLSYDQLNGGIMLASNQNVGLSTGAPQARLDVLAAGLAQTDFAQIWRDSGGTIVSSLSATGVMKAAMFVGDGSKLTNVPGTDDLGDHTATQDLNLAGYDIVGVSTITVSSITTLGSAVVVSTDLYVSGKYYGDGSELNGVSDDLGNHTALTDLNMDGHSIVNVASVTATMFTLGNVMNGTSIRLTPAVMGGILVSTPASIVGYLQVSSHSAFGNNGAILSTAAFALSELYSDIDYPVGPTTMNIGMNVSAVAYLTASPPASSKIVGGSFRGAYANTNLDPFNSVTGLSGGTWGISGNVTNAYGIYAQNQLDGGSITNNYGMYVDVPNIVSQFAVTNNYGVYIAAQSGYGSTHYNLFSAGAASKNKFEGKVTVGSGFTLASRTKAQLMGLTPESLGETYFCTDCGAGATKQIVVSTGTSQGNFADAMGGSNW